MLFRVGCSLLFLLLANTGPAFSGEALPPEKKQGEMQISAVAATLMIKGAILALHQANMTGNYSVLRDLGTPVFREAFDQTALAAHFQNLRTRKIALDVALLLSPNLTKKPEFTQNHELIFVGEFPTSPQRIQFNLAFMQIDGNWRLAGIGVDAVTPQAVAAAAPGASNWAAAEEKGQMQSKAAKKDN